MPAGENVRTLRLLYLAALLILVPFGLWLRFRAPVPEAVRDASGGAAYVLFFTMLAAFIWPRTKAMRLAAIVVLATCGVEFSQAWHARWLDQARTTLAGRLVLGTTFDWSDFPPYFYGGIIAWRVLLLVHRFVR